MRKDAGYRIRINPLTVIKQILAAALPLREKLRRIRDVLWIQITQTGPDFLNYTLPYHIGSPALAWLCGQRWAQAWWFRKQRRLIQETLRAIGMAADEREVLRQSLAAQVWRYWRLAALAACPPDEFKRWMTVHNIEMFHQAYRKRQGLILVVSHVAMRPALLLMLDRLGCTDVAVIGGHQYPLELMNLLHLKLSFVFEHGLRGSSLLMSQFYAGKQRLEQGGVLVIAGDGLNFQHGLSLPFHGRLRRFGTGAAELAVHTGAVMMPVDVSLRASGQVTLCASVCDEAGKLRSRGAHHGDRTAICYPS